MTSIPALDSLDWSDPEEINTKAGPMMLRKAPPNNDFWEAWKEHKDTFQKSGFNVSKFKGNWSVNWWTKKGEDFRVPLIASIVEESPEVELESLVHENDIDPRFRFQIPLIQYTVAAMKKYGASLNGCGTGIGETFITLFAAKERQKKLLVICPKPIVPDWQRAATLAGVQLAGVYGWEWMKTGKTEFGHWDMIPSKKKNGKARKGKFIWNIPDDVEVVFDEVHRASAIDTQNAELVISAKNTGVHMYMLSATIANDPTKMRATGYVLGLHEDGRSFFAWMARHGVKEEQIPTAFGGRVTIYKFRGNTKDLQKVHKSIFPHKGVRIRAEDLGDKFPETQIIAKAYQMDEEQSIQSAYDEMNARIEEIMREKGGDMQANILVEILRARQRIELFKVPLIESLAHDLNAEGNSIFIAVNFKETLDMLINRLNIKSVIRGGQSDMARREAIDAFQNNEVDIIGGMMQACREGLNLHDIHGGHPRASLILPPQSAFNLRQVLGRIVRAGGITKSIQRILYCANTIEEDVCRGLATKLDQLDLLMDGHLNDRLFPATYSAMREE
jgi:superfamily II DNA or RNA helicase